MESRTTDEGVGLGVLFGLLALLGAGGMLGGEVLGSTASAIGFAAAVTFGCLAVVALHVYPE